VDVLAEQVEDLEAAQKYTLRAMLHGIDTIEDLQLFLGLGDGDTGRAVAGLLDAEYIDYRPPADGEARRLQLLPAGLEAARDAQVRRPRPTSIQVVYDRLSDAVTGWRRHALRRSSHRKSDPGRMLLPPVNSRPVQTVDLSVAAITSALDARTREGIRILGVSGVTENRTYSRDAILLVFKDHDFNMMRLGLEVDGVWSELHAAALERLGAVDRLGLSVAPLDDGYEPVAVSGRRLGKDEVVALQATAADTGGDRIEDTADETLRRAAVRWLGGYEHPQWLDEALTTSERRLLIASPSIRQTVVTDQWVRRLERLSRAVDVTIFWGDGGAERSDAGALEALHAAAQRSSHLAVVRVDEVRARVLVGDDYYIQTSFDWLSFRGEPSRTYRLVEGDLIQDRHLADSAYDKVMSDGCAAALQVAGTLPAGYRDLVGSGAIRLSQKAEPSRAVVPKAHTKAASSRVERRKHVLKNLVPGQVVSGRVKSLTTFGAFVDLGDVDGLIHNSQLAASPVRHPSQVVAVGQTVTVLVISVDQERERVSLSLTAVPT
jgi:hypothetical protein